MKTLNRKLVRDLGSMKGQVLAISAVVACGIAVFVMAHTTLRSLQSARDSYYTTHRFAEVFSSLVRAPLAIAERARGIPGVAQVDHRVTHPLTLEMPDMEDPASGQILSIPRNQNAGLNLLHLKSGRWPDPDRPGEVLVSEPFARAHQLQPGDRIEATLRGRRIFLTTSGIALSPEFVIQLKPGEIFPDDRRYGIFWMPRRQLEAAADMKASFNDLTLTLTHHTNPEEVIRRLDLLLAPFGGGGAYTRRTHHSARFVDDELKGLRTMSIIPPAIFLGVATFLLNISLRRILTLQREQIAALKAFGYSNREVASHYAKFAIVIVALGTLCGCLVGTWLATGMTAMYASFYRFPLSVFSPGVHIYLAALALALTAGAIGAFAGLRITVKLPPAEAMRPEPPANYRPTLLERIGLPHLLSQPARMVLRELERRPIKAALTTLGISFSCAVLVVGNFGKDAIDYLVHFQFGRAERDDARVQFVEPTPGRARYELTGIDGVMRVEPFRNVAVRLRHGPRSKQVAITGVTADSDLFRLLDTSGQVIPLNSDGLVLSTALAELLAIQAGDTLQIEVLEGARPVLSARVTALVDDFAGTSAYMERSALNRLLHEGDTISGAFLQVDPNRERQVYSALTDRPAVIGITFKQAAIESFLETFAENLLRMRTTNLIFACIIAIGVVYNSARISLSERARDLATLRIIGLTRGEVSTILLGELAILTLLAIPVGLTIGYLLCALISKALATEMYRIPLVINSDTVAFISLTVLAASTLSAAIVRRRIDKLDMITALKTGQ